MVIRGDQFDTLSKDWSQRWIDDLVHKVRESYPDRVPDSDTELRTSVEGWVGDAHCYGFKTQANIERYVLFRARTEGERRPFRSRLADYLTMYYPDLIGGLDVGLFAQQSIAFGQANNVVEEEGVTWLSVIVLAGRRKNDSDKAWMTEILAQNSPEEERVRAVHDKAVRRGWIAPDRP